MTDPARAQLQARARRAERLSEELARIEERLRAISTIADTLRDLYAAAGLEVVCDGLHGIWIQPEEGMERQ